MRLAALGTTFLAIASVSSSSLAQTKEDLAAPQKVIANEVPLQGYTYSAFGAGRLTFGIMGFAGVNGGATGMDSTQFAGGGRVWGSPVDRLTLFFQIDRSFYNKPAPSATATVRIAGDRARGWALGAGATWKAEGFANGEQLAGEMEGSLLFSVDRGGWHLDTNAVVGVGLAGEEEGAKGKVEEGREVDAEAKLRVGYDVTKWMRLGLDGRMRYRLSGDKLLPGNHRGDFTGGPEILLGWKNFFVAANTGPSTVGVANGWGWSAMGSFGGALML